MIITESVNDVEIFGDIETVEFQIKTDDSKMFHILSNLYSNPLGAVVREISTNCSDSHKAAGIPEKPFDIILPGRFDSGHFIKYRDYGTGMDYQTIISVFTMFGQSTKTNSNIETGCLGLGSKSPLAITDSYTVTNIKDGIKTMYSISKDANRKPVLNIFDTQETTEENGLLVTVPLLNQYKDNVIQEIIEQLQFFDIKPRVLQGDTELDIYYPSLEKYIELVPNFKYKSDCRGKSKIVQGGVHYDFDPDIFLKSISSDNNLKDFEISDLGSANSITRNLLSRFLNNPSIFILFMDMGKVSFAPSREELIYDNLTLVNIGNALIPGIKVLLKQVYDYIITAPDLYTLTNLVKNNSGIRKKRY